MYKNKYSCAVFYVQIQKFQYSFNFYPHITEMQNVHILKNATKPFLFIIYYIKDESQNTKIKQSLFFIILVFSDFKLKKSVSYDGI